MVPSKKMTKYELLHPARGLSAEVKRFMGCRKKDPNYNRGRPLNIRNIDREEGWSTRGIPRFPLQG